MNDALYAELRADISSIKEMLATLVANSATGKKAPKEELVPQEILEREEESIPPVTLERKELVLQGTAEQEELVLQGTLEHKELAPQGTIERTFGHEGQLNRAAQQLIGEQRESEAEDGFRHSTKLQLAAGRAACEQRAMEKKPGRLLRPPSLSEPTTWARPNRINGDEEPPPEPPPGQSQSAPKVRYGTIVPDHHLTMEMVESWETRMQNIVRTMIQERVGVESPPGTPRDHLRSLKLPLPTPAYAGEDNLNVFQSWLQGLLRWFSIYMLTGNTHDVSRRITIPMSLEGDALKWYNTVVNSPEGVADWTFEDIILMMHARFITKQAAVKAAEKFRKCKYTKGVYKFYTELDGISSQMVEKPDQYTFKTK